MGRGSGDARRYSPLYGDHPRRPVLLPGQHPATFVPSGAEVDAIDLMQADYSNADLWERAGASVTGEHLIIEYDRQTFWERHESNTAARERADELSRELIRMELGVP